MGILRLYLALCVVIAHSSNFTPWTPHGGDEAVQLFYVISGFYMQLISGKYGSAAAFYRSRALRIFVPYWTIAIAVLIGSVMCGLCIGNWLTLEAWRTPSRNGFAGVALAGLTNVTILGQDWLMFVDQDAGEPLHVVGDLWRESTSPLWWYLVIPQAWTVGLELTFYMLVPMLARLKSSWLAALCAVSLFARFAYYSRFGHFDPWTYRFFPFELALFLTGMLSCRAFSRFSFKAPRYVVVVVVMVALIGVSKWLTVRTATYIGYKADFINYAAWALLIPFVFAMTSQSKCDRFIGELSYPVYLCHYSLIGVIALWVERKSPACGILSCVLAVAVALYQTVIRPVDRMRHCQAPNLST